MKALLLLLILPLSFMVQAKDSDGEKLIKGCNELIGIYKNKNEKRLLASQLVSSSDAMLAGYCMGVVKVIDGFGENSCKGRSWYELAEIIAEKWEVKAQQISVNRVLKRICRD